MLPFCSIRDEGLFRSQMTDDRDQMEARAEANFEGNLVLRMRRGFNKMTIFDDLLTTFGRLLTIDVAGGNDLPGSVSFDIKGLWIVASS
jgi:hypothetical protein